MTHTNFNYSESHMITFDATSNKHATESNWLLDRMNIIYVLYNSLNHNFNYPIYLYVWAFEFYRLLLINVIWQPFSYGIVCFMSYYVHVQCTYLILEGNCRLLQQHRTRIIDCNTSRATWLFFGWLPAGYCAQMVLHLYHKELD